MAIYKIDENDGSISLTAHGGTGGAIPRNFEIDPSGAFIAAANQDSDNIVMFHRDAKTGDMLATGNIVSVGTPICVRFL